MEYSCVYTMFDIATAQDMTPNMQKFCNLVNEYTQKGWEVSGGISVCHQGLKVYMYQALTRKVSMMKGIR